MRWRERFSDGLLAIARYRINNRLWVCGENTFSLIRGTNAGQNCSGGLLHVLTGLRKQGADQVRNGNGGRIAYGTACTATDTIPSSSADDPTIAVVPRGATRTDMWALG
jgi:hypothetical protein